MLSRKGIHKILFYSRMCLSRQFETLFYILKVILFLQNIQYLVDLLYLYNLLPCGNYRAKQLRNVRNVVRDNTLYRMFNLDHFSCHIACASSACERKSFLPSEILLKIFQIFYNVVNSITCLYIQICQLSLSALQVNFSMKYISRSKYRQIYWIWGCAIFPTSIILP